MYPPSNPFLTYIVYFKLYRLSPQEYYWKNDEISINSTYIILLICSQFLNSDLLIQNNFQFF